MAPIFLPAALDPVKVILSTPGWRTNSSETSRSAVMALITPGGRPTLCATSAIISAAPGDSGDDLIITVQPASKAGAILYAMRPRAPFQGTIAPTTPTGSRTKKPVLPPA